MIEPHPSAQAVLDTTPLTARTLLWLVFVT